MNPQSVSTSESANAACALLKWHLCLWSAPLSAMTRCGSTCSLHLRKKLLCWTLGSQCNYEPLWLSLTDYVFAKYFCLDEGPCDKSVTKLEQNKWAYWEGRFPCPAPYSSVKTLLRSCISFPWSVLYRQCFLSKYSFHAIIQILLCNVAIHCLGDATQCGYGKTYVYVYKIIKISYM